MIERVIRPDIIEFIEQKKFDNLKIALVELFPQDIAELIEDLEDEQKGIVFRLLPKSLATEVFENLTHTEQENLLLANR